MIPLALLSSGLTVMMVMYFEMNRVMPVKFNWPALGRAILMSLPLAAALAAYRLSHILMVSVAICALGGIYFAGTQYLLIRNTLGGGKAHE